MSSFYGTNMLGGGSSGSSVNYNDIQNAPILNLVGASENKFINLAGLDTGHYNLKGYYKLDSSSELMVASDSIEFFIQQDKVTKRKVIQYFSVEDETLYSNLIIYNDFQVDNIKKRPIDGAGGQAEIFWVDIDEII